MAVKNISRWLAYAAVTLFCLYASIILLLSLPAIQSKVAGGVASLLSDKLGAKVEIGCVKIGLWNRVIIDDITIHEPSGKTMATIARMSASVEMLGLASNRIVINAAQLFGANITLYKTTPKAEPNYQFIIDALKGDDDKETSPIDLKINSLIMRRTNVSYDVKSEPTLPNTLDANHLSLKDCGFNLSLHFITDDSLNCSLKRLQAIETNSRLRLKNTQLALAANKQQATIATLQVEMPQSTFVLDTLNVEYSNFEKHKEFTISKTHLHASIAPSDITAFLDKTNEFNTKVEVDATVEGNHEQITINELIATCGEQIICNVDASILKPLTTERTISANVNTLTIKTEGLKDITHLINADSTTTKRLVAVGNIDYKGYISVGKEITSFGTLTTDAGQVSYDLSVDKKRLLQCNLNVDSIALGQIVGTNELGKASFNVTTTANLSSADKHSVPEAHLIGNVTSIEYKGYKYHNIAIDASSIPDNKKVANCLNTTIDGIVTVNDDNLSLNGEFTYHDTSQKALSLNLDVEKIVPHALLLTPKHQDETFSLNAMANLSGNDFNNMQGLVNINDFNVTTPTQQYNVKQLCITAEQNDKQSTYIINSDFLDAHIEGIVKPTDIAASATNIIAHHLPELIHTVSHTPNADFNYDITLRDCALMRHLTNLDCALDKPLTLRGHINTTSNELSLALKAPSLQYSGTEYRNIALSCNSSEEMINTELSGFTVDFTDEQKEKRTELSLVANAHNNTIRGSVDMAMKGNNRMNLNLKPVITLSDSLGKMKTLIALKESYANINDTLWTIQPSMISIHEKAIACHGIKCVNNAGSSITIEGAVSNNDNDSIIANLSNVEIKYILEAVNFHSVRFAGKASGQATAKRLMASDKPFDFNAHLKVKDFTLQEGSLGDADIYASWNRQNESIDLKARFIDHFQVPIDLSNTMEEVTGITSLTGWISPAKNDMRLDIMADHTNADFIHGFLDGVFSDVNGSVSGPISVVGLSPINLIGKAAADISFRLRATNVPYRIAGDTLRLQEDLLSFSNARMYDMYGNSARFQAQISHHNLKNFQYSIHADMDGLCAYDESTFNSDKFYATLFARGNIDINGSDGHPLRINADITPTKGSVFAYDAATPDAIIGNSFVEFFDRDSLAYIDSAPTVGNTKEQLDSLAMIEKAKREYNSDIYFNANIHLTPDCEVKLRMDNVEDGYMRTFGYADLNAQWHNKGSFLLFGNYDIREGSYRLYLQDLIFRDLALQPASSVVFNGNPFDAAIHLVCHHSIPGVPISDLTSTKAFSQNNKVRVNCILDITGYLESMDFKFDMELPNVSDEVRQLARSMINSEEEMNTQMIYLLGFGRFYPSEYARSEGNTNSDQAVNSLLSSTISGQINQLLSNMTGQNSNWNFGSSLSTGENGWEDLDVEGVLSGRLFNERLLVNGNFGYRDNALTNQSNFVGDFEVKLQLTRQGNLYVKAYNQANDRYFTKATLNTQGLGLSWQLDFDSLFPSHTSSLMPRATLKSRQQRKESY